MPRLRSQVGQFCSCMLLPALVVLAGCGGALTTTNPHLTITGAAAVTTGSQLHLLAVNPETGAKVPVRWTIAASDNAAALGPGSVDATGLYTAPGALSGETVGVTVVATSVADPARSTSTQLTLTPGFAQPLSPQNAAVAPGQSLEITAHLAEVNAGDVTWSLRPSPPQANGPGQAAPRTAMLGTLTAAGCVRAPRQFTTCTATYTAPAPGAGDAWVVANANSGAPLASLHVLLGTSVLSNPVTHRAEQPGVVVLGSSGGNDNDFDTYSSGSSGTSYIADCCGGTLGALVEDQSGQRYVLSNNHVLAESDQARLGDSIVQPGTIDDACVPLSSPGAKVRAIGALRAAVPLDAPGTNVDAALAAVSPGTVDPSGAILELGAQSAGSLAAAPPTAGTGEALTASNLPGIEVAKSGRTTGLTCSTVSAVDLAVKVDYYRDCAETQPYTTRIFTGQIGIPGNSFSDAGDSGALIVDAANAQPVGLFYAGSTGGEGPGLSIANPVGDVLSSLGARIGSSLSIVGTPAPHPVACLNYDSASGSRSVPTDPLAGLPAAERTRAREATRLAQSLINREKGIFAVAAGASADRPGEAAVLVYIDRNRTPAVPISVAGVRTVVLATDAASVAQGTAPAGPSNAEGIHLSAAVLAATALAARQQADRLLSDPAIFAVGVTQSLDDPQQPALLVALDTTRPLPLALTGGEAAAPGQLPITLDSIRVRYLLMHRFRVTRGKDSSALTSCELRARTANEQWTPAAAESRSLQH